MKKTALIIIGLLFFGAVGFLVFKPGQNADTYQAAQKQEINIQPMKIQSSAFLDNQVIPAKYTCDGEGINPPLEFTNVPKEAKSLALIISDPDVPSDTWIHWVLWNIAPGISKIEENSLPPGAMQGKGSSGQNIYGGPCPPRVDSKLATTTRVEAGPPPSGTHHYIFTLYALGAKLSIPSYSTSQDLEKAMNGEIISKAQLVGLYSKNK